MHWTACVSMMLRRGAALRPIARRRRRATSSSKRSNSPCSSHLRNQPYTVRQGGPPGGSARHGPPMRKCHAIARTTAPYGVARPLRGGSARSSHRATCATAFNDTISFRRASWRARCASVHIVPLSQTTIVTAGSDRDQAHRPTQTGSKRVRWVWSNTSDPAEWDRKIAALIASGQASADDEFLKFGWLKDRCGGADEAHEHLNPAPSCAPGCAHGGIGTVRG